MVKTYNNVHHCPQRRDNRLVTGPRIADKYEHIIRANPSWKLKNIQETVLIETWFLGLLQKDLQIPIGGNGWVIISDQQKVTNLIFICQLIDIVNSCLMIFICCAWQGLLNSVVELFPNIEHRMCTRHIHANRGKNYRSEDYQKPF